ncbi:MAG: T9SS type A sorting domain-containing protein [Flavobacteriales bacterium]|nr:T9SS type A sorting domain-containing protein [Flavobacteriales bacterium]
MKTSKIVLLGIVSAAFGLLYLQMRPLSVREKACTKKEYRSVILDSLWQGANEEFISAGNCDQCHGYDPAGLASTDGEGADVNLVDDWSSTMMANSAKDPFWRAKVSHEVFINPQLQSEIEGTCTRCHASLGRFAALMNGQEEYSIEEMLQDSVALDGVSCLSCHRQAPQPTVAMHTGQLIFHEENKAFGQYFDVLVTPMALATGYVPEFGSHTGDSKLCAACHSLITPTVDLQGNLTGEQFVEQATWHEWLNSEYSVNNVTCQDCHLPKIEGQNIRLAAGMDTPMRPDFRKHTMAGGNTTMLKLMRDNHDALGIYAGPAQFNETISATMDNLQNKSLEITDVVGWRTEDTAYFDMTLKNITGHKLPSGYPARRMTVVVVATDDQGNEIFRSGGFDENFYVLNEDAPFEPHHQIITDEEDVQIYEMVMGDVENNRTTVLTRAKTHLKDNRLVPKGFTTSSGVYDTTEIVLNIPDPDFNLLPNEGSGADRILYHIPTNGYQGPIELSVEVYYQSLPPIFLEDILQIDTEEINHFASMFENADKSPVLMKSYQLSYDSWIGMEEAELSPVRIIQTLQGKIEIISEKSLEMEIYSIDGKRIKSSKLNTGKTTLDDQLAAGTYLIVISDRSKKISVEKVIIR